MNLIQRCEDGHLVVCRLAESSAVVEVDGEGVVAEQFECLVVVAVHVPHQEVHHGQVDHVEQPPAAVVGRHLLDEVAVLGVVLPGRLPPLVVAAAPGVAPRLARHHGLARQEGGQAHLQRVGRAADGVRGITVVGALAVEAEVARWRDEEGLEQISFRERVDLSCDV